ncbi:MAG: restriction endonuclease subunit S [Anaerolineae bacterium]|nr:restriction endonuclease subunit S [Anaerolineae bacterium]
MSDDQMNERSLPEGWVWTTLGKIGEYINGRAFKPSEWGQEGRPIIRIQNLTKSTSIVNRYSMPIEEKYIIRDGELLISWSATLGAFIYRGEEAVLNQHIFKVKSYINKMYLCYLVTAFLDDLKRQVHGSGMQHITKGKFDQSRVPLAPLPEQHRIVAAIESHLTRLDVAVAALERVRRNLARYKAAVLQAACTGRLVPTDAALHPGDYEPADVLLQRILQERRARWEVEHPGKHYPEPASPDTDGLPELPVGWCWTNIGQLKSFSLYGPRFSSDDYAEQGKLVLRTSDISESGKVNIATPPKLPLDDTQFAKYKCVIGDLLITRTGSLGTLAVFNDKVEAIPGAYLIQYRLAAPLITSWYVFYFLKSPKGQSCLVKSGAGVGRPNLNAPTIEGYLIPLPPLAEQHRIVAEVERRFSVIQEVETLVATNLARAARLRQSILKRAFEGRLVSQDPNDEPAGALLARIKQATGG